MTSLVAFLIGNRVGRLIATGLLIAGIVALILWRVFTAGKNAAVVDQKLKELQSIKTKVEVDNEIARLPASERRERLRRWVHDEG